MAELPRGVVSPRPPTPARAAPDMPRMAERRAEPRRARHHRRAGADATRRRGRRPCSAFGATGRCRKAFDGRTCEWRSTAEFRARHPDGPTGFAASARAGRAEGRARAAGDARVRPATPGAPSRATRLWGLSPKQLVKVHHIIRELVSKVDQWFKRISGACEFFPGCTPTCEDDPASPPGYCAFRSTLLVLQRLRRLIPLVIHTHIPSSREANAWTAAEVRGYQRIVDRMLNLALEIFDEGAIRSLSQSAVIDGIHGFGISSSRLKPKLLAHVRGKRYFVGKLYNYYHDDQRVENKLDDITNAMVLVMSLIPARLQLMFKSLEKALASHPSPRPPSVRRVAELRKLAARMTAWVDDRAKEAEAPAANATAPVANATAASAASAASEKKTPKKKTPKKSRGKKSTPRRRPRIADVVGDGGCAVPDGLGEAEAKARCLRGPFPRVCPEGVRGVHRRDLCEFVPRAAKNKCRYRMERWNP